jgi:DNA (cytosine-5)-methyltransferase 1
MVAEPMTDLTAVSLFAGVGGFDLALERNGVKVVATAEIDKHARSVLAKHFPDAVQYDDVRKVTADGLRTAKFIPERGIITGGFPCQDLSVAGKRAGLVGARSGLFYEIARIADETKAKWLVLENVPGLLTSQRGADMGAVVGTLVELGYGVAWRVLDAQHFGVPQRRRRVFIVAERAGDPARAAQVLFERTSVRGDSSQGRAQGQDTPRGARQGAAEPTLYEPHHNDARSSTGIANTLVSRMGTGGGQVPLAVVPTGFNYKAGIDIQDRIGSTPALKVSDGGGGRL